MSNPFDGVISDDLKLVYYQSMEALINSLALPCRIIYPTTSYINCTSCNISEGERHTSTSLTGRPSNFRSMAGCAACNGEGKIPVENTEDINLAVIWSYKQFFKVGSINLADASLQTLSRREDSYQQIKRAKELIVDTDVETIGKFRFILLGEPVLVGFGDSSFIVCNWKRI